MEAAVQRGKAAKIVLLGDSGVGKSSICLRFCQDKFDAKTESTIGASFFQKNLKLDDTTMRLEIWDTAGQERFNSLGPMFYRGAQAAFVVYDITNAATLQRARKWIEELHKALPLNELLIGLIGNKSDRGSHREVYQKEASELAREFSDILFYKEISAKTGENVKEVFEEMARAVMEKGTQTVAPIYIKLQPDNPGTDSYGGGGGGGYCCGT